MRCKRAGRYHPQGVEPERELPDPQPDTLPSRVSSLYHHPKEQAMTEPEYPRWVDVQGDCRCTDCGDMVDQTWRWYETPTSWTRALCWDCSSRLLRAAKGAIAATEDVVVVPAEWS